MSAPGPQLTAEQLDRLCESLRVNPSWEAAADYAGISTRTLRDYRDRSERYETRADRDEEPSDLAARRAYRDAREEWADGRRWAALARLARLDAYLDSDPERGYWLVVQRLTHARSRLEIRLHVELYNIATGKNVAERDRLAAIKLLRTAGWRERYAERIEVTGADGGALEVAVADAEERAQMHLEQWQAKRAHG